MLNRLALLDADRRACQDRDLIHRQEERMSMMDGQALEMPEYPSESRGLTALADVISELERELDNLYARIAPVLMPAHPTDGIVHTIESRGTMSPFGEQIQRLRGIYLMAKDIHQRLDL